MSLRSPKKVYSGSSLEQWFDRLSIPWETGFSSAELDHARALYRTGQIQELELTAGEAIVSTKIERQPIYAFIEWKQGALLVRSSAEDRAFGRALAAAGIYEIEELLADEMDALPVMHQGASNGTAESISPSAPALLETGHSAVEQAARPMHLLLSVTSVGLRLQAFWEDPLGGSVPTWGEGATDTAHLAPAEREKLIRITSHAHSAGFIYRTDLHDYLLSDLERIPPFVRDELPRWRRHFMVRSDGRLKALEAGSRSVDVEAYAALSEDGMRIRLQLAVGGAPILGPDAARILRNPARAHLLPDRGIVQIDAPRADAVGRWSELLHGKLEGEYPRYMLYSLFGHNKLPLALSDEMSQWRNDIEKLDDLDQSDAPEFLRGYQRRGLAWMARLFRHGCHPLLADEMGLGKTVQVLALLHAALPDDGSDLPNLVVCPASVIPVWEHECQRFFPETQVRILKKGNDFCGDASPCLWVASYSQLRRHRGLLDQARFRFAVLDEAQFIKNPDAKVTHACLAIRARYRLALTGTPLENRQLDLWTIFRFLMPGLLGTRRRFEEHIAIDAPKAEDQLRRQIAPFVIRRTKAEVLHELPEKIETILSCPLSPLQEAEYRRIADRGINAVGKRLDEALRLKGMSVLTLLTRLRQACCDPGLLPWMRVESRHSGKLLVLREKLGQILAGESKVVVFSQFVGLLNRAEHLLKEAFPNTPILRFTGQTTDRAKPIREFQELDGHAIILVSLRAGGTGITLHSADYVFLLDPWWNPAVEAQAIDRVHRIGQEKTVFVYRMITRGTVEERIERLKSEKSNLFAQLVGTLNGDRSWASAFHSLEDLVALDADRGENDAPEDANGVERDH